MPKKPPPKRKPLAVARPVGRQAAALSAVRRREAVRARRKRA